MQGELSTPHQRVIIGSLWSTWRLRAQRKQLSLHPTLDCLSQQTPFPSPLPASLLQLPSTSQLNTVRCTERKERGGGDAVCDHVRRFSEHTCPCIVSHDDVTILPLGFSRSWLVLFVLKRAARLSGERTPCNRWYISVDVFRTCMFLKLFPQKQAENFSSICENSKSNVAAVLDAKLLVPF